jgi:hypothetical protein
VSRQLNHPCAWGPLVTVLIISIKNENVNRRVRCAARIHMLDECVHVRRVRRVYLAVSKLFIY